MLPALSTSSSSRSSSTVPESRHFNFMFLPFLPPYNVLLCLATICGGVLGCHNPHSGMVMVDTRWIYSGYRLLPIHIATLPRFKCAAHPFLRMNCKTPHIFHVIVWLPETGTGRWQWPSRLYLMKVVQSGE